MFASLDAKGSGFRARAETAPGLPFPALKHTTLQEEPRPCCLVAAKMAKSMEPVEDRPVAAICIESIVFPFDMFLMSQV